ncbi:MAG TPA: EamA family transporter [Candidatus Dormibacteraeota bacterium]|nr:EamA family transporter [Candidatus Dormibacteraeota bacterium]
MALDTPASAVAYSGDLSTSPTLVLDAPDTAVGPSTSASATLPPNPAPTRARLFAAFAVIYFMWGATFLAVRFGIESLPPLLLGGFRHFTAGLILYPLARWRSQQKPTPANWRAAALIGVLLPLCGNGAVCWSEQLVPSGITALIVGTVSLWMVLIEWVRPGGTRPTGRIFLGLVLGFIGLGFLVGPSHFGGSEGVSLLGTSVLVLGSLCWAAGSVFSKHIQLPRSPLLGAGMQSLVGGALLLLVGLVSGEGAAFDVHKISSRSIAALGYLIIFGSLVGFSAYTYLLRVAPPGRVGTYAYVNPVVAMFLGWLFAGESLTLRTVLAGAVILTAVILVITAPRPATGTQRLPAPGEA